MSTPKPTSHTPTSTDLASFAGIEIHAVKRPRMEGSRLDFLTELQKQFTTEVALFTSARAAELAQQTPLATQARQLAQNDLVTAVRKKAPEQMTVLEACLKEYLNVATAIGRLPVKHGFKTAQTYATECIAAIFKNVDGGANATLRHGGKTLQPIRKTVGIDFKQWVDLGTSVAGTLPTIAKEWRKLAPLLDELDRHPEPSARREEILAELRRIAGIHYGIRGLLFEIYVWNCKRWQRRMHHHRRGAQRIADDLGPDWEVITQRGDMHLVGKDNHGFKLGWDMAILIVNRKDKIVKVHTTAEVKSQKDVEALTQTVDGYTRERLGGELSIRLEGGEVQVFTIEPLPPGHKTNRYAFFAEGGKISGAEAAKLAAAGLRAVVIESDLHLDSLDAATFHIMSELTKLHDQLVAQGKL